MKKRRSSTRKKHKKLTTEKLYELIMEEHEHNPIVGEALWETKLFLRSLGYSRPGADTAIMRLEREYDLYFYRQGRDHHHTENGAVINNEFGVTRASNGRTYTKILAFYVKRIRSGMTKEQAIKECHEHYDPILAKESSCEPQTEHIDIFTQQVKTLSGKNKDLSNLEIEL